MANEKNEKDKEPDKEAELKEALRNGVWILVMLSVLTFGEFLVAVIAPPWGMLLFAVAFWKTFYVVKSYMHIGRLFGGDEEAH